jgi:hypothetical protein
VLRSGEATPLEDTVFRVTAAAPPPPECRPCVLRDEEDRPPAGFGRSPWAFRRLALPAGIG